MILKIIKQHIELVAYLCLLLLCIIVGIAIDNPVGLGYLFGIVSIIWLFVLLFRPKKNRKL